MSFSLTPEQQNLLRQQTQQPQQQQSPQSQLALQQQLQQQQQLALQQELRRQQLQLTSDLTKRIKDVANDVIQPIKKNLGTAKKAQAPALDLVIYGAALTFTAVMMFTILYSFLAGFFARSDRMMEKNKQWIFLGVFFIVPFILLGGSMGFTIPKILNAKKKLEKIL